MTRAKHICQYGKHAANTPAFPQDHDVLGRTEMISADDIYEIHRTVSSVMTEKEA